MPDEPLTVFAGPPLPCPWCGGKPAHSAEKRYPDEMEDEAPDLWSHVMRCRSCAAQGPWIKRDTRADDGGAKRAWNRRFVTSERTFSLEEGPLPHNADEPTRLRAQRDRAWDVLETALGVSDCPGAYRTSFARGFAGLPNWALPDPRYSDEERSQAKAGYAAGQQVRAVLEEARREKGEGE